MAHILQINLNNYPVGTLTSLPSGKILFSFNENYLQDPNRPVLSQSFLQPSGPYIPTDGLALTLGDSKDMRNITLANFKKLVKKAEIPEDLVLQTVSDTVHATFAAWSKRQKNYELPTAIRERIQKHMNSLALKKIYR